MRIQGHFEEQRVKKKPKGNDGTAVWPGGIKSSERLRINLRSYLGKKSGPDTYFELSKIELSRVNLLKDV